VPLGPTIGVKLPIGLHEALVREVHASGRSASAIIRAALRRDLNTDG